jgi:hypothetical protein
LPGLDSDDIGAEVCQQAAAQLALLVGQIDHAHAGERLQDASLIAARTSPRSLNAIIIRWNRDRRHDDHVHT